jgi:hypothetical protein
VKLLNSPSEASKLKEKEVSSTGNMLAAACVGFFIYLFIKHAPLQLAVLHVVLISFFTYINIVYIGKGTKYKNELC